MIEALMRHPDWEANYHNKLYYFNRQQAGDPVGGGSVGVSLGKKVLCKQVLNPPLNGCAPYNILTEEIYND